MRSSRSRCIPGSALARELGQEHDPGDDRQDPIGHGTPVAGLVAGTAATGIADDQGFLYGLGVAPGAQLYAQKDCFEARQLPAPAGGWEEFTRIAVTAGASGSNNSWGHRTFP